MLAGFPVRNHEDAERAAGMLLGRGPKTVILTLGKRGALIAEEGKAPLHVEAEAVQAVDTTGAGDAFVGSLSYFLACRNDLSLSEAVKRAGRVASLSVQREGAQSSFPMRDEVTAWLG
jgi:ribokinase